jgi:hypothetical protein
LNKPSISRCVPSLFAQMNNREWLFKFLRKVRQSTAVFISKCEIFAHLFVLNLSFKLNIYPPTLELLRNSRERRFLSGRACVTYTARRTERPGQVSATVICLHEENKNLICNLSYSRRLTHSCYVQYIVACMCVPKTTRRK